MGVLGDFHGYIPLKHWLDRIIAMWLIQSPVYPDRLAGNLKIIDAGEVPDNGERVRRGDGFRGNH